MTPQRFGKKWRVQVSVGGKIKGNVFTRKQDAERQELELKREQELVRAGMEAPKEKILFIDYAAAWMKRRKKTRPESTWKQDELNLRLHWLPTFSARPVASIRKHEIQEQLQTLLDSGLSNATHNRNLQLVHKIFEDAIDDRKLVFNPSDRIARLSEKKKTRPTGYWSSESDIEAYIAAAYADAVHFGLFATLALFAGARVGEIIALRYGDIDPKRKQIRICRTLERETGKIEERTKGQGEGGEYLLPLLPRVELAIEQARRLTHFNRNGDYILQRLGGFPMSYWTLQKAHKRICKAAAVPVITIHDMRRTFASNAERLGFSRGEVQAMLGHESITTTENYIRKNIGQIVEKAEAVGFGEVPGVSRLHTGFTRKKPGKQD